ncbi:B-cell receptor CD22-like [Pelodytes ibericus]
MHLVKEILLFGIFKGYFLGSVCGQRPPSFPKTISALSGSCVVIPCVFSYIASNPDVTIIWYQHKPPLHKEIFNSRNSSLVDKSFYERTALVGTMIRGNCTLKIKDLTLSDGAQYFPLVSYKDGTKSTDFGNGTVSIQILTRPSVPVIKVPQRVIEGEPVAMTCYTIHTCPTATPSLTWNLSGQVSAQHRALTNGEYNSSAVLTYTPKYQDNGRSLKCISNYPSGQHVTKSYLFNVMYAPKLTRINNSHEHFEVKQGDSINMTCDSTGNPPITHYTWHQDTFLLINNSESVLWIENMESSKSGYYHCVAHNSLGADASLPVAINCSDCTSRFPYLLGGIGGAILLILTALAGMLVILKKRKKSNDRPPENTLDIVSTNVYINLRFSDNAESLENPYTALQNHNRCPDYEEIKKCGTDERPPTHDEYEEIYPQKVFNVYRANFK